MGESIFRVRGLKWVHAEKKEYARRGAENAERKAKGGKAANLFSPLFSASPRLRVNNLFFSAFTAPLREPNPRNISAMAPGSSLS